MALDLRRRVALALVGVSVAVATAMAMLLWSVNLWMQSMTLDHFMARELGIYLEAQRDPMEIDSEGLGLRYFRPARSPSQVVPAELLALEAGVHPDMRLGGQHFYVLVRDVAPGDRTYVAYDISGFKVRQRWLSSVLLSGVLITAVLAWLLGRWATGQALQPLDGVVGRIRGLQAGAKRQRLETRPDYGELHVIVEAFNAFMSELDRVLERERVFASAASHELRTPLTALRGAAEVLATVPEVPPRLLARIEQAVAEASNDLDALLALSQGRDLPLPEPLHLAEFLPRVGEPYLADAEQNGTAVRWEIHKGAIVDAAPSVIGLVFKNLLRNAIRAAPEGQVRIMAYEGALVVEDNGEGIAPELLPHVFEPGTRGHGGGTGLGLYIASTLAQRSGWQLTLTSRVGHGTRAEVRFAPLSVAAAGASPIEGETVTTQPAPLVGVAQPR